MKRLELVRMSCSLFIAAWKFQQALLLYDGICYTNTV